MKLSIVTALKDGFGDFARTIPTILGQEGALYEWIIIDDGSTRPVAAEFPALTADPRVKILRNETGNGQTKSLNLGIREAVGDWIVRMDGDDLARADRLALTLAAITAIPHAQLLFSNYSVIDEADREWAEVKLRLPLGEAFFTYLLSQNNPICHPTVSFRRQRADGSLRLYREDLVNAQDYALWKEIYAESGAEAFAHIPEPLVKYRIARESLSGARAREQREELKAIRENKVLTGVIRNQSRLGDPQKDAMQAFRLLYYRFVGRATPAARGEDLAMLKAVRALPALWPKAAYFLFARPLRKILLRHSFSGIYD